MAACVAFGSARADDKSDLRDVELAIEQRRYYIPRVSADAAADLDRWFRMSGEKANVTFEMTSLPPRRILLADGRRSPLELQRFELRGTSDGDVPLFLAYVIHAPRVIVFEALRLEPVAAGRVAFHVETAVAGWVDEPPSLPSAPPRDPASMVHQLLVERRAILDAITALQERARPRRFLDAFGAFAQEAEGKAIALTGVRAGEQVRFEGIVLGTAAREALRPTLEKSGFIVDRLELTPRGDCQAFSATLRVEPRDRDTTIGPRLFDNGAVCKPRNASPPARLSARGTGGVTMHLRDIDAVDFFVALNAATKEGFIIDPEVEGHLDADFDHAAPEAVLAALKTAGIAAGPGPLHFVRPAGHAMPSLPAGKTSGEPISVNVHDAELADVLQVLQMNGGAKVAPPAAPLRLSIFATDEPIDRLQQGLLAFARDAKPAAEKPQRHPRWNIATDNLFARDLTLAGVAETAEGWQAYAYLPGTPHRLVVLGPDTALRDGRVAAIAADGVTLATADGKRMTLALPPLR